MTIEERLERLEKENRRLKYLLFSLLFLVAGVFFVGATAKKKGKPVSDEIRTHRLVLVDSKGKDRGVLGMDKECPFLGLYDEEGISRISLAVEKYGSILVLNDENAKAGAVLSMLEGIPKLVLSDLALEGDKLLEGARGMAILTLEDDGPSLQLYDGKGKEKGDLAIIRGIPALVLSDGENPKVGLKVVNGEGYIDLYDSFGKLKFSK
jgi:hypothetical protein